MSARSVFIILMIMLAIMLWLILSDEPGEEPLSSSMSEVAEGQEEWPDDPPDDAGQGDARASSSSSETGADDDTEADSDQPPIFMGGEDLDLEAIDDVDAKRAELEAAFEAGDVHAAYQLYQLSFACSVSPRAIGTLRQQIEEESDPQQRERLKRDLRRHEAIKGPCEESHWGDPRTAYEHVAEWQWKAAEAGHADAMYSIVFSGMGRVARDGERLSEEERMATRRAYLVRLREGCHADSLHSMGVHLSRDSAVTADFELHDHWDRDGDSARQMEGFAHRYAAARLREEGRPAEEARIPDQLLSAAEETQATRWAEDMLADCP